VSADPSPVPARDDAPLFVYAFMNADTGRPVTACFSRPLAFEADAMSTYAGVPVRIIACAAVPSPDVLRAECEALGEVLEAENDACLAQAVAELRDTLTRVLRARRALLAAVTRDGEAGR
jgi:hypothetical protein